MFYWKYSFELSTKNVKNGEQPVSDPQAQFPILNHLKKINTTHTVRLTSLLSQSPVDRFAYLNKMTVIVSQITLYISTTLSQLKEKQVIALWHTVT
jgi:hypothetical protein